MVSDKCLRHVIELENLESRLCRVWEEGSKYPVDSPEFDRLLKVEAKLINERDEILDRLVKCEIEAKK